MTKTPLAPGGPRLPQANDTMDTSQSMDAGAPGQWTNGTRPTTPGRGPVTPWTPRTLGTQQSPCAPRSRRKGPHSLIGVVLRDPPRRTRGYVQRCVAERAVQDRRFAAAVRAALALAASVAPSTDAASSRVAAEAPAGV